MKSPTVSAILPNYNYAEYLSSRLDEVLNQSYPVAEVIILDDASTDASVSCINTKLAEVRESFPNTEFKTILNKKNSGSVFSQWQKGIKQATSDYLWIAELDDSANPEFLKTAMLPILKDSNNVLSYTNSKLIGSVSIKDRLRTVYDLFRRGHFLKSYTVAGSIEVEKNLAIFNSIPNVSACVIKNLPELSTILNDAKNFRLSGDWYLYLSLLKYGNLAYSPKKLNSHRLSNESVTSQTKLKDRFNEIKRIHAFASQIYDLPEPTKARMKKMEQRLRSSWSI
jgi:glycosyltransferase involved in cell wall biosynthesis